MESLMQIKIPKWYHIGSVHYQYPLFLQFLGLSIYFRSCNVRWLPAFCGISNIRYAEKLVSSLLGVFSWMSIPLKKVRERTAWSFLMKCQHLFPRWAVSFYLIADLVAGFYDDFFKIPPLRCAVTPNICALEFFQLMCKTTYVFSCNTYES